MGARKRFYDSSSFRFTSSLHRQARRAAPTAFLLAETKFSMGVYDVRDEDGKMQLKDVI